MATLRIDPAFARRRTAELMVRAQREIPLFHVSRSARLERLAAGARDAGVSVTVALLPHVARWLAEHPVVNAHWTGEEGARPCDAVDLGVAWAHRDGVLVVPVLSACATWSPSRFADEMARLKERSAADAFTPRDFRTPSFTLSNLGGFGVETFTSLVTPPQVAVLSVSAGTDEVVWRDGAAVPERRLPLTLGVDHRALDGATAARALADLVTRIETGA